MKKVLITGFSGFVAHHYLQYLYDNQICWEVFGVDISIPKYDYSTYKDRLKIQFKVLDLLDKTEVYTYLKETKPDYILHLASFSSVAYSWEKPCESFANNTNLFLNVISAVRDNDLETRILSVGSSEEYGNVREDMLPLRESYTVNPISPYAVARVSQEMLSKVFAESNGMDIVMTRSFNHIGIWQDERFVVPSFIHRIKTIKDNGDPEGAIETGDISIVRDFVDVRDVVRAYHLLFERGRSGEIYNICTGNGVSLKEVIEIIADKIGVKANPVVNPAYVRPNDNKTIIGSNEKIKNELGWIPKYDVRDSIGHMIEKI